MINLYRLAAAYGSLVFLSLYIAANIGTTEVDQGLINLYLSGICFAALVVLSADVLSFLMIKRSTIILIVFLLWFFTKYNLEASDYQIRQVTIGTTGGVVFSLLIGLIVSYNLRVIYEINTIKKMSPIVFIIGVIYMALVLISVFAVFNLNFENVRADVFLLEDRVKYQRSGDLMIIQMLTLVALASVMVSNHRPKDLILGLVPLALVLGCASVFALMSQLLGSNKGLAASATLAFIYSVCYLAFIMRFKDKKRVNISSILLGGLGAKLLLAAVIGSVLVVATAAVSSKKFGVDISQIRAFGFGSGEVTSVTSRNEIFIQNFIEHASYSPIFGNTQVEKILGDEGQYVHSWLSVITHLGLIGFVIFMTILWSVYLDMTRLRNASGNTICTSNKYSLVKLLCFSFVLLLGLVSAFFVWMPLWFSIALFGNWFNYQSSFNHTSSRRRRTSSKSRKRYISKPAHNPSR